MIMRVGALSRKILQRIFKSLPVDGIPILCYHSIDSTGSECSVSLKNFSIQMKFLKEARYRCLSLSVLYDKIASGMEAAERYAVITFDDGFENNYTDAFPVLKAYGFSATFFIPTGYVGKNAGWLESSRSLGHLQRYPIMSWAHIKTLNDAGMEIGSHSVSHPYLSALSDSWQENEICGSKEILEREIKKEIRSFCYPSGGHNQKTLELVKKAGYETACTTNWGVNKGMTEPLRLKRILLSDAKSREFPFYFCRGMNLYSSIREGIFGVRP